MTADTILNHLTEGTVLEGPHWTEPVKVLMVKTRGSRIEVQAVGMHTKRLWTKLLKPEEFHGAIKVTSASALAALDGNSTHFRLAAEAHRIRLAFQYDPHFAVSVSQVDPLPHQSRQSTVRCCHVSRFDSCWLTTLAAAPKKTAGPI